MSTRYELAEATDRLRAAAVKAERKLPADAPAIYADTIAEIDRITARIRSAIEAGR